MTEQKIDVVALVVDNGILTFYKVDGSVHTVTQGDPRGAAMSDEFLAQQALGKEVVSLFTGEDRGIRTSHFASPRRNPLVRFFRAPIAAIKKLLGGDGDDYKPNLSEEEHAAAAAKVKEIAARLMKTEQDATPETTDDLPLRMVTDETPMGKDETVIAVTEDGIVPNAENLTGQIEAADEGKAPSGGAEALLLRLSKVAHKRRHSAADLMRFLKHIDLPILEDGSFLAYKRLNHKGDGVYTDPHTGKVFQRVGDIVQMDEKMVDPDRRRDCSNGLHVGSRQYMGSFSGSGTMLVLVQPEDAIAVPDYGTTKLRACRYEILGDLSDKAHDLVNKNQPVDKCEKTMELIANIVAGARPPKLGVVNIGGSNGSNLTYTIGNERVKPNISLTDARAMANGEAIAPTKDLTEVKTIDEKRNGHLPESKNEKVRTKDAVVKPAALKEKAKAAEAEAASGGSERVKKAAELYARMTDKANTDADRRAAAVELKAHKLKTKISYIALGLPETAGTEAQEILDIVPAKAEPKPSKLTPAPEKKQTEPVKTVPQPAKAPEPPKNETRQDRARRLWGEVTAHRKGDIITAAQERKKAAQELRDFKKSAKVSWDSLGLGRYDVEGTLKKLLD